MSYLRHEKIGDTVYPVTYDGSMVIIDYPERQARAVTKKGQEVLEELKVKMMKLMKDMDIRTDLFG